MYETLIHSTIIVLNYMSLKSCPSFFGFCSGITVATLSFLQTRVLNLINRKQIGEWLWKEEKL